MPWAPIAKIFLDYLFGKLVGWLPGWLRKQQKKSKDHKLVNKQRNRLKKAIDVGYDGEALTPVQTKELVDAARELIRDY